MEWKQQRSWENAEKCIFEGAGAYDIPVIRPEEYDPVDE